MLSLINMRTQIFVLILLTWSVIMVASDFSPNSLRCSPNVNTAGTTLPRGDIYVRVGEDLEIYCMLNSSHPQAHSKNSSHLLFFNSTDSVHKPVSSKYVTIVNDTTIRLHISKVQKSKSTFYCKMRSEPSSDILICLNTVFIDTPPQEITNFSCVSHNWQNLTCSWRKPHNYITTTYELGYKPGEAPRGKYLPCPANTTTDTSCSWSFETDPVYRNLVKEYIFKFRGSNQFGNITQRDIKFMHYEHVIPSPARNLQVYNISVNSVQISWQPVYPIQDFPGGLVHRVEYMWDRGKEWKQVNTSNVILKSGDPTLLIDNLEYPNTAYDVRVYMRSGKAKDANSWSAPSYKNFRTLPTKPQKPPKVDIGSFQVVKSREERRDFYIYWQALSEREFNGGSFTYLFYWVTSNGEEILVKPSEQTYTYAKFVDYTNDEIQFRIYSSNNEGRSSPSEIKVPAQASLLKEPLSFTKIAYDKQLYELSWILPPRNDYFPFYYTLFWCSSKRDRPFQCDGFLNWTTISGDSIAQNVTVPTDEIYQFAISKNSVDGRSSGMVWSTCTVIKNNFTRMNNVYIRNLDSHSIVVAWQLECSDRVGVIRGFVVYYCPVWYGTFDCKEPELNVTVNDMSATGFNVTHLRAYTLYKLKVAVLTADGPGEPSLNLLNSTLASAPSKPPQIINITDVSNISATFVWKKPSEEERNGKIMCYEYCLNSTICGTVSDKSGLEQNVSITDLEPSTVYVLTMRAYTNAWSDRSAGVTFETAIGRPNAMANISLAYKNDSFTHVEWGPPKKPGGPLSGYQMLIIYDIDKAQLVDQTCSRQDDCFADVKLDTRLDCKNNIRPTLQMRAFNLVLDKGKNVTFFGNWSDAHFLPCVTYVDVTLTIVLALLFCMFSISFLYYLGPKLYEVYQKRPKVLLPDGMKPNEMKKHLDSNGTSKPTSSADEECLIRRNKSENENDCERFSLNSRDTQTSECNQSSSTSAGSELEPNSTASTPPMQTYNLKSTLNMSAATLLDKINMGMPEPNPESNLSYVIIGANNAIIQKPPHPPHQVLVSESAEHTSFSSLEFEDTSLPCNLLSSVNLNRMSPSELDMDIGYSAEPPAYTDLCHPISNKLPSLQTFDPIVIPPMKQLVISTNPNMTYQTITTTMSPSSNSGGYQPLPIAAAFSSSSQQFDEPKCNNSNVASPTVSAIVINKGNSGYVTVSCGSVEPSESSDSV